MPDYLFCSLVIRYGISIGIVRDGEVLIYESPVKKHTTQTAFDISNLEKLPKVSILYFSVDADPGLVKYAAKHSDGLVIAGAGAGEFSKKWIKAIKKLDADKEQIEEMFKEY